ncbi:MAG: hypothetical protein IKI31_02440 [Treponema sp.]|nr:hypothetical protein [Treponema sp.]
MKNYIAKILLVTLSLVLIGVGLLNGDPLAIFQKAIFICMECIGIG